MKRIRFKSKHKRQQQQKKDLYPYNERIRSFEVDVIDEQGNKLGILETKKAIEMAKERELDLVAVSPKAQPPVAKFLDYGRYKYQKEKQYKKQLADKKGTDTKNIRLSPRIGKHDFDIRIKQADKFLQKGDKIKIDVNLKGRERQHPEVAENLIKEFLSTLSEQAEFTTEQEIKRQGNRFSTIIYKK